MRVRLVIVLCSLWAFVSAASVTAQRSTRPTLYNEIYGTETQRDRRLDLYLPEAVEEPMPIVVMLHGSPGDKGDFSSFGIPTLVVTEGYAAVGINYTTQFPDAVADTYCALGWIVAHAEEYHLDPSRIALFGVSYGGYVSALTVGIGAPQESMSDCPYSLPDDFELAGIATNAGVFFASVEGITNYLEERPEPLQEISETELRGSIDLLLDNPPDAWHTLDLPIAVKTLLWEYPIFWIDGDEPPFLIIHGTGDSNVPVKDAFDFGAVLAQNNVSVDLVIARSVGHVPPPRVFDLELMIFLGRIFDH